LTRLAERLIEVHRVDAAELGFQLHVTVRPGARARAHGRRA
jgi:hypothetical protein